MSERHAETGVDARSIAASVLTRVMRDGAYAAAALSAELNRAGEIDPRERALATELVYGVLRSEAYLLKVLSRYGKLRKKDYELRSHLLIGAYQLFFLDKIPDHAAVSATVSGVRRLRGGPRLAGFANAVLRKVAAIPAADREPLAQAVAASAAPWLLERLVRDVGADEARALLGVGTSAPHACLRLRQGAPLPTWLKGAGAGRVEPSPWAPGGYRVRGFGDLRSRPGYSEGQFVVQEEGAQLLAWAVGARPTERVLDACAGRGQKSSLLAERIGPDGSLWATDLYPTKLEQLRAEFDRLGLPSPRIEALDWSDSGAGRPELPRDFDRALVDVPCTGDGTLRRRPEIGRRLRPEDPHRLADQQAQILRHVAEHVRDGGRVVYATCSVLREECEDVLARVNDCLQPVPFDAPEVEAVFPPGTSAVRLLPGQHGTDGYFVASLVRRRK